MQALTNCQHSKDIIDMYCNIFGQKVETKVEGDSTVLIEENRQTYQLVAVIKRLTVELSHCQCYYRRDMAQQSKVDTMIQYADELRNKLQFLYKLTHDEASSSIFHSGFAKKWHEDIIDDLKCWNKYFSQQTFSVNERISIADFYLMAEFATSEFMYTEQQFKQQYPHLLRFMNTIRGMFPEQTKMFADKFAAEPFVLKANKPKVEKKEQPKQEPKIVEEPKPKAKKYSYKFPMEDWKRHYKNLDWDNKEDWQPYFYEHFDPEEMSLWVVTPKDRSDFKLDWMTCNRYGIYSQQLINNKANQNSFGNWLVVKRDDEKLFNILGVFLMPGKEIMQEFTDVEATNSYDFIRIDDSDKPEVREFIKRVWNWDEENDMIYHGVNYGKCQDGNGSTFV